MREALPDRLALALLTEEFDDEEDVTVQRSSAAACGVAPSPANLELGLPSWHLGESVHLAKAREALSCAACGSADVEPSPAGSLLVLRLGSGLPALAVQPAARVLLESAGQPARHCVLMLAGGYFVVGAFEDERCLSHKTAHAFISGHRTSKRPTRSHGGGQSRGTTAEEAHFHSSVQTILEGKDWTAALLEACAVFVYAPGRNRHILRGLLQSKVWEKIVSMPLPARAPSPGRPNYQTLIEAQRALCVVRMLEGSADGARGPFESIGEPEGSPE